jgi:hypothetical protein
MARRLSYVLKLLDDMTRHRGEVWAVRNGGLPARVPRSVHADLSQLTLGAELDLAVDCLPVDRTDKPAFNVPRGSHHRSLVALAPATCRYTLECCDVCGVFHICLVYTRQYAGNALVIYSQL